MNTMTVNFFGAPGSGKTTAALETVLELRRRGMLVEYVPEYAKHFVWELQSDDAYTRSNARQMLNGTLTSEFHLFYNQAKALELLQGQVQFVVTDSPILLTPAYVKNGSTQQELDDFTERVFTKHQTFKNFNLIVRKGQTYESTGRIHTEEEAGVLEESIFALLNNLFIPLAFYSSRETPFIVDRIIRAYQQENENEQQ